MQERCPPIRNESLRQDVERGGGSWWLFARYTHVEIAGVRAWLGTTIVWRM